MFYRIVAVACLIAATSACPREPSMTPKEAMNEETTDVSANDTRSRVEPSAAIAEALSAPERPEQDRERDDERRPAEILAFLGVSPGMKIVDLMAARGYYTEILARLVGPQGGLYVHNNQFVLDRFARQPITERVERLQMPHVVHWDRELDALDLPAAELDVALMVLFYHDTYWQNVDRAAMNRGIFATLKPGGIYGVVDHHAQAGAADSQVKTLHRIEAAVVKREILAAGFEFVGESDVLAHPEDDRTSNVFAKEIRGRTDRFVFKFRKPR